MGLAGQIPQLPCGNGYQTVGNGYHIAYVDVGGMYGNPRAIKIGNQFYQRLTATRGLAKKVVLEGVSRGGLFVYNWAAQNPDKVACIYCDTPVCDIKSWPGGKGTGRGARNEWQQCLTAFALTEEKVNDFAGSPIHHALVIAKANLPILHIVSENDRIVPPKENTYLLNQQLKQHGHKMEIISVKEGTQKSQGHHFDHPDPDRVVDFIVAQTETFPARRELLRQSNRILFLGDSITYAGQYISDFETWMLTQKLHHDTVVINAGLPSETVSGLSEKGHAGGRFPRPDLFERLDRVLAETKPNLVFACYGINCGIYQPFDEQRFTRYQHGIEKLKSKVEKAGATLVLITPPFFDDQRAKKTFSYNAVLDRYANWLMARRDDGWQVVDLHSAMAAEVTRRRITDSRFTFQPDSVHPNSEGQWFMASQLIAWFGDQRACESGSAQQLLTSAGLSKELLPPIRQRSKLLRDAYLSKAGHKRPGIKAGLPLDKAHQQAERLSNQIQKLAGNEKQ